MKNFVVVYVDESCGNEVDVHTNVKGKDMYDVLYSFTEMTFEECELCEDIEVNETDHQLEVCFGDGKYVIVEVK